MKREKLFNRHPAGPASHPQAFTSRGFVPDLLSEHAASSFPSGNFTMLENGFVPGREGMMPVSGFHGKVEKGQPVNAGSSGAGSFAARNAFGAKG